MVSRDSRDSRVCRRPGGTKPGRSSRVSKASDRGRGRCRDVARDSRDIDRDRTAIQNQFCIAGSRKAVIRGRHVASSILSRIFCSLCRTQTINEKKKIMEWVGGELV